MTSFTFVAIEDTKRIDHKHRPRLQAELAASRDELIKLKRTGVTLGWAAAAERAMGDLQPADINDIALAAQEARKLCDDINTSFRDRTRGYATIYNVGSGAPCRSHEILTALFLKILDFKSQPPPPPPPPRDDRSSGGNGSGGSSPPDPPIHDVQKSLRDVADTRSNVEDFNKALSAVASAGLSELFSATNVVPAHGLLSTLIDAVFEAITERLGRETVEKAYADLVAARQDLRLPTIALALRLLGSISMSPPGEIYKQQTPREIAERIFTDEKGGADTVEKILDREVSSFRQQSERAHEQERRFRTMTERAPVRPRVR